MCVTRVILVMHEIGVVMIRVRQIRVTHATSRVIHVGMIGVRILVRSIVMIVVTMMIVVGSMSVVVSSIVILVAVVRPRPVMSALVRVIVHARRRAMIVAVDHRLRPPDRAPGRTRANGRASVRRVRADLSW
jgi:hypothetical protein